MGVLTMKEKVFRDPVLNLIRVYDPVILDLIGTSEFQRLRRIKQLGVTSYVFHGAEHSRFAHSLGVYEIARRFADHLGENYRTKMPGDGLWDPNERLVLLCAALLHDVGHGPYSHTFEHIFGSNHEEYTQALITSPETEINQVLRRVGPDFPEDVAAVIAKTYPNHQVVQLISSQIDADRMDYLLRDAYNTGATYGEFDLSRISQLMRPYVNGIAFEEKGMYAIEDYVISRYQMYVQVYFHPVSRAFEVLLQHLLMRAKQLFNQTSAETRIAKDFVFPALRSLFSGQVSLKDYLKFDDVTLLANINQWRDSEDQVLADLAQRFLDRKPFKSIEITAGTRHLLPHLRQLIEQAGYDPRYYTAENDSFDLPYDDYKPHADKPRTQIELMAPDGTLTELSKKSALVDTLTGRTFGDARFFFPKEMLTQDSVDDVMAPIYREFQQYIHNGKLVDPSNR